VFCIGEFPGLRHPLAFARLVRTIRAFGPTIVHTHLQSANLYGRLAARLAGVPIVVSTEHNVYTTKARRYVTIERWLARTTDALVAVSEEVRQFLSKQIGVAPSAIRVIRNGVAVRAPSPERAAALRARIGGAEAGIVLGTIASLTPKKGHQFLLRAVAMLRIAASPARSSWPATVPSGRGSRPWRNSSGSRTASTSSAPCRWPDVLAVVDVFVLPSLVEACRSRCSRRCSPARPWSRHRSAACLKS
jgi:hypothetical protein